MARARLGGLVMRARWPPSAELNAVYFGRVGWDDIHDADGDRSRMKDKVDVAIQPAHDEREVRRKVERTRLRGPVSA